MLPRAERIGTTSFSTAFSQGRVLRHPLMVLRVYRRQADAQMGDKSAGGTRAAFAVSKKLVRRQRATVCDVVYGKCIACIRCVALLRWAATI
jgi:hypothetical protein